MAQSTPGLRMRTYGRPHPPDGAAQRGQTAPWGWGSFHGARGRRRQDSVSGDHVPSVWGCYLVQTAGMAMATFLPW